MPKNLSDLIDQFVETRDKQSIVDFLNQTLANHITREVTIELIGKKLAEFQVNKKNEEYNFLRLTTDLLTAGEDDIREKITSIMQQNLEKEEVKRKLTKHLEKRTVSRVAEYRHEGKKTDGVTAGALFTDSNGNAGLHKISTKNESQESGRDLQQKDQNLERGDWVIDYLTAPLYKLMLHDRTYDNELVVSGKELQEANPKKGKKALTKDNQAPHIDFRTHFIDGFQSIDSFRNEPTCPYENKVENFEKVIASAVFGGEIDHHQGNIGFVKEGYNSLGEKQETYYAVKIDHGRSAHAFYKDEQDLRARLYSSYYDRFEYDQWGLELDLDKFKSSIDEITKISDEEIENKILARLDKLKAIGYDLSDIDYATYDHSDTYPSYRHEDLKEFPERMANAKTLDEQYQIAGDFFKEKFAKQKLVMQDLSQTLAVI